ncbi:MAG: FKBP-type peptidyl-prolyl cis-trans isomerase [Bacteroidales bacterium]|nr:FKBP-type peptidyl-prolyl cis-trans isomerase [Bacteroidales bacterium]
MKKVVPFLFVGLLFVLVACDNTQETTGVVQPVTKVEEKEEYDPFIEGNRNILRMEDEDIQLFLKRYGWNTDKKESGLYIEVLETGSGETFKEGDEVQLDYVTQLLDGEVVYSSKEDGVKKFKVDKSEEIAGLHEAVKYLRHGARARIVLPSYLAYGVAGDGNKIKGRKSLAMTIEISD